MPITARNHRSFRSRYLPLHAPRRAGHPCVTGLHIRLVLSAGSKSDTPRGGIAAPRGGVVEDVGRRCRRPARARSAQGGGATASRQGSARADDVFDLGLGADRPVDCARCIQPQAGSDQDQPDARIAASCGRVRSRPWSRLMCPQRGVA